MMYLMESFVIAGDEPLICLFKAISFYSISAGKRAPKLTFS